MQALPVFNPIELGNSKKRSRASIDDDFESHYFKKRLISTTPNLAPSIATSDYDCSEPFTPDFQDSVGGNVAVSAEEQVAASNYQAQNDDAAPWHNRIHLIDVNGTLLPMEQRPGETKYSIPEFVLSDTNNKPLQPSSGQLILYEKNPILACIEKESAEHQQTDDNDNDNDSITSEENDEEYDPMDLD